MLAVQPSGAEMLLSFEMNGDGDDDVGGGFVGDTWHPRWVRVDAGGCGE